MALLNSHSLPASLAPLEISEADRVQAGMLPNPLLSVGRLREGADRRPPFCGRAGLGHQPRASIRRAVLLRARRLRFMEGRAPYALPDMTL